MHLLSDNRSGTVYSTYVLLLVLQVQPSVSGLIMFCIGYLVMQNTEILHTAISLQWNFQCLH